MIGTRPFGYDRQPVPEIGMGCYRITTDMGVDRPTALATLQRAYELGVRFFDTAPLYGAGEADALLGEAFAHVPDDEIIIGAKLSGPTDNLRDYSYDNCMRGFDQTLQHLKRDSVHVPCKSTASPAGETWQRTGAGSGTTCSGRAWPTRRCSESANRAGASTLA